MNILYISNVMEFGGVERCIIKLSKEFNEENKVVVCTAGGPLVNELIEVNIKHYEIMNTESKKINTIFKNLLIIAKIILENKIDLVHSHHRMTTLYCKILSKFIKFKLIHTQHLCIEDKVKLTKLILKKIPIITVSNGAKSNLINIYGLKESSITTIYNTIETKNFNFKIDSKVIELRERGYFLIAQISRLVDYKGIYDFINVAKSVCRKYENIKFLIIGDGEEKENIEKYIDRENLRDCIFILGNKDNVINYFRYIDITLLCSYIEGLPLVPIESISQGTPVIASDIPGTNEVVEDMINGLLFKAKDIEELEEKIIKLYKSKELYEKLKRNTKICFDRKFSNKLYYEKHKDVYNTVIRS